MRGSQSGSGAMNVAFGKPRSALPPSPREHNTHSVNDCGFPGVVLPDQDGCLAKIDGEVLDGSEILNVEPGDAHGFGLYAMLDASDRDVPARTGSRAISRPAFSLAMRIS